MQGARNLATLLFADSIQVACDGSTGVISPVVPANLRRKIFDTVHVLAHPGTKASVRRIIKRFAWDGLQQDFREWTRWPIPCQTIKVHRLNKIPIGTFVAHNLRFHHVHIDRVGPLSHHEGSTSSLPAWIDSLNSLWPAVTPRPSSSPSCKTRLLDLAHLSVSQPTVVPSSNQRTPSSCMNSWVATASGQLRLTQPPTDWWSAYIDNFNACAGELVYGPTLRLSGEFFRANDTTCS